MSKMGRFEKKMVKTIKQKELNVKDEYVKSEKIFNSKKGIKSALIKEI